MSSNPGIGTTVIYYEKGDEGNPEPYVGITTRVFQNGAVTIYLFPTNGGWLAPEYSHRQSVFHRDAEILKNDPQRKVMEGTWEYPEAHNRRVQEAADKRRLERQETHDRMYRTGNHADKDVITSAMRTQVLNLHAEGKDATAIAKHTQTKKAIIEQILEEAKVVA